MSHAQPDPVFTPWDGTAMVIRHHEDRERIGHITQTEEGWRLAWVYNYIQESTHLTGPEAVAAACDSYPAFLAADYEATREFEEQQDYGERFVSRRANAVARALRVPTGGQRGWQSRRPPTPQVEE